MYIIAHVFNKKLRLFFYGVKLPRDNILKFKRYDKSSELIPDWSTLSMNILKTKPHPTKSNTNFSFTNFYEEYNGICHVHELQYTLYVE